MRIEAVRRDLRRRVRAAKGESGVTLVELLVAITLFTALTIMIISTFSTFTTTFTKDRIATDNINIASVGTNELTRVIRSATSIPRPNLAADYAPFVEAQAETLTIYAYIDTDSLTPKPVKIRFSVNTTTRELVETRWNAVPLSGFPNYWSFSTTAASSNVIARRIVVPAAGEAPLFNYYKINTTTLKEELMLVPTTGLIAADLEKVAVVEVRVKVQSDNSGRAKPATIINRVGIPNLGISRLGPS